MTMPNKMTKKQKVENFIVKNPEAGPAEIAKKVGCTPAYAGNIRRELARTRPDLNLPVKLKRGRKAKSEARPTPTPKTNPVIEAQRAAWEEFEADMLMRDVTAGKVEWERREAKPNLFRRMLNALGLQ